MSKGSKRRPCLISKDEEALRWALALGKITRKEYEKKLLELRNGT